MELGLKGKVIGVTGAASVKGIGFGIAKAALAEGAQVFLCDLNPTALEEAAAALKPLGGVQAYTVDVSDEEQVKAMFDTALAHYGRLDAFVNNAGIYPQAALCDMSVRQWDTVMAVNLRSVFLCGCEAFRRMKKNGGVLINAASYAAVLGSAGSGAYAASKAAVHSLTKTMAAEMAPFGVRVNGFIPGVIETGMTQDMVAARRDQLVEQIALGRLGKPGDVASAVIFLLSDAANYLTGTFIEVSGGKLCVQNPDYGYKKWKGEV